ncbi:GNAT family N-acetyltransferase [Aeromicrobium endophyticum]|uniref:GNAT family N-acetyltransferase n=1 Tax=Aeromicrobium endophyticum TaxID=2292704 RepID=A0A371P4V1_9ACTN|nr:GNAT family N-acetyltransferase [Aeromicrobium endophyticum]REK70949.1 GNAT family N-acetyltransferase [Aeromicrobium endophyticum]
MILSSPDPAADPYVASMVLALQRRSYAVEADLIGDQRLPTLHEDERALAAWRGRWLMAWDGVELVGAAAWSEHDDHVDIAKMMVGPQTMRRGIGSSLLLGVLAASEGPVVVATGRDNVPAVRLYAQHGFSRERDVEVPPGIWVSQLRLER